MKIDNPELMGKTMRERRHGLGFTIEQMAEAVGISPITIMRLELGRLGYIHERTAKALEVPRKIVRRMVLVPMPVDAEGRALPASALSSSLRPEPQERISGDAVGTGALMPVYREKLIRAHKARIGAKNSNLERQRSEGHGQSHVASPLKKMFLWMARHVK